MDKENKYYVYEQYDVNTNEILYVGKGCGGRWKDLRSRNKKFWEYYNTHQCDVRKIQENMNEDDTYKLEKEKIAEYSLISPILCNIDEGGRKLAILSGNKNPMYHISPKERMDEEAYKQWRYKHTLIVGEKNPNYGKYTLKGKYKIDKEEALRKQSRPGVQNGRAVKVKMFDENHIFIKEFSYIGEACQYLKDNNFSKGNIDTIRSGIWKANKDHTKYLKHYFEY